MPRNERWAVGALAVVVAVTAGWWAFALWPVSDGTPEWFERARAVCFGIREHGLPGAEGWILLVGQPLAMLGMLLIVWGGPVRNGLARLLEIGWGRAAVGVTGLMVVAGLGAAGWRVVEASPPPVHALPDGGNAPLETLRQDRTAPPLGLVDQWGERVDWDDLRGRTTLVTFAFGHCESVCPLLVRNALRVQEEAREPRPRVVVVTLDPWRDTPSRLSRLAGGWGMEEDAHLLSGSVAEVEAVLDGWEVPRERDTRTGEVFHPALTYAVDREGRIAWALGGGVEETAEAVERLRSRR